MWATDFRDNFRGGFIKGRFAQLSHRLLYRRHQLSLHGPSRAALLWLAERINALVKPQLKRERQCVSGGEVISRIRDLIKKAPRRKDSFDINTAIREVIGLTHDEERGAGADNRTTHAPTFLRGIILEARARRLAISR